MVLLLATALVVAAVMPLWTEHRREAVLAMVCGLVLLVCGSLFTGGTTVPADRPLQGPLEDYVGSGACVACHPDQHSSWQQSFHRTMTQAASRATVIASFERLELRHFGQPVRLQWRGEELWVDLVTGGAQPSRIVRPVVQLTGSHHTQAFWYSTGKQRELALVPLVYRIDEGRWLPISAAFVLPPEQTEPPLPGTWNKNCLGCHTTAPRPRVDSDRTETMVAEFGIACEACHGPGQAHVTAMRDPDLRYLLHLGGSATPTILDPKQHLPVEPQRSAQVCGQCHSVSILKQEWFDSWREHGSPYRPGGDLDATTLVLDPTKAGAPELQRQLRQDPHFLAGAFWPDGTVRLSGREYNGLVRSPCFTKGQQGRTMTCLSCHQMHKGRDDRRPRAEWADDQLAPGMRGNAACTQCHEQLRETSALTAHTHHAAGSSGSDCYNCHMSYTSYGLLKALRSHTIESPRVQTELSTGRPNACNQCHLDRTLAWTNQHLQAKWGIEPAGLDEDQAKVAASVRWALTGDAGLRALAAWSMGWSEAQQASGNDWQAPYLGQLLADPYRAVRLLAERSLRSLPQGDPAGYDFLGEDAALRSAAAAVQQRWQALPHSERAELLIAREGLRRDDFERLLALRDNRPVHLVE